MALAVSKLQTAVFAAIILVSSFLGLWCFSARSEVLEYENVYKYQLDINKTTKVMGMNPGATITEK